MGAASVEGAMGVTTLPPRRVWLKQFPPAPLATPLHLAQHPVPSPPAVSRKPTNQGGENQKIQTLLPWYMPIIRTVFNSFLLLLEACHTACFLLQELLETLNQLDKRVTLLVMSDLHTTWIIFASLIMSFLCEYEKKDSPPPLRILNGLAVFWCTYPHKQCHLRTVMQSSASKQHMAKLLFTVHYESQCAFSRLGVWWVKEPSRIRVGCSADPSLIPSHTVLLPKWLSPVSDRASHRVKNFCIQRCT